MSVDEVPKVPIYRCPRCGGATTDAPHEIDHCVVLLSRRVASLEEKFVALERREFEAAGKIGMKAKP